MLSIKNTLFIGIFLVLEASGQTAKFNPFFYGNINEEAKVYTLNITDLGDYHYDIQWNAGNIHLKNGDTLVAYYMRYDIVGNHLEVIVNKKIRGIHERLINSFVWFDAANLREVFFVNSSTLNFDDKGVAGFLEILANGKVKLLRHRKVVALADDTAPSLVNDTNSKIQTVENYYFARPKSTHKIGNSKKKNLDYFNSERLEQYINMSKLRFKSESDLKAIVRYYNGLK